MIFIHQSENDKENINIEINVYYASTNYSNSYFMKSQSMKFKTYQKCKKGFFSRNKLHAHLKTYKNKIKNINKIVFDSADDKFKNIIFNFNDDFESAFAIVITNFTITFINNNEIAE